MSSLVWHAFVIERRKQERSGKTELGRMARQSGIGESRRTGTYHEPIQRHAARVIGGHQAHALTERERGCFAGGAEDVEPIASIGKQVSRERDRTGAIGSTVGTYRSCDRRDHSFELAAGHVISS